jgi:hypothetical protein
MAFDVIDDAFDKNDPTALVVPQSLNPGNEVMALAATSGMKVRNVRVERNDTTNEWNLNGETWYDVVDSGFQKVLRSWSSTNCRSTSPTSTRPASTVSTSAPSPCRTTRYS